MENNFAHVEHLNQVLLNSARIKGWECFDTYELLKQYPSLGHFVEGHPEQSYIDIPSNLSENAIRDDRGNYVRGIYNIRYNSFIISIERFWEENRKWDGTTDSPKGATYYKYTFEVRNSLWTGLYSIKKSNGERFDKGDKTTDIGWGTVEAPGDEDEVDSIKWGDDEKQRSNAHSNVLIVWVKGNYKGSLKACFYMTMDGAGREISVDGINLSLDGDSEFTDSFDESVKHSFNLDLSSGLKPSNITVTMTPCNEQGREITSGIPSATLENAKPVFTLPFGAVKFPGVYYCKIVAKSNENVTPATLIVKVNKVNNRIIEPELPRAVPIKDPVNPQIVMLEEEEQYRNIWKGSVKKFRIPFTVKNEVDADVDTKDNIEGTPVDIVSKLRDGTKRRYTEKIKKDSAGNFYIETTISFRGYYEDSSDLEISVTSTTYKSKVVVKKLSHPWYVADNYNDILGQLYLVDGNGRYVDGNGKLIEDGNDVSLAIDNPYGTDWIFLKCKTYSVIKPLVINRNLTITTLRGKSHSILDGNSRNIIRTEVAKPAGAKMKVNLVGVTFKNAECAIHSGAGTRLLVDRCYFTNNSNTEQVHKGCSIYIPDDDYSRKHPELWRTEIRNSYFKNNKGNEIYSGGVTRIDHNLFVTNSSNYLQQPEVKVVNVRSGEVSYTNNKSYINVGKTPMSSNHSFAKALAYVNDNARFNGAGPNQLGGDMKLPLYGDYKNQAYTYAIYYYPYDNIRTEIVCSPRKGYERKATGHSSTYKRWVYYDGYYFVRWEHGRNTGNTHDPWTEQELKIPDNLGVMVSAKEKFIKDYDPDIADSRCTTSVYDKK